MRHEVEVRLAIAGAADELLALACDAQTWAPMPGADVRLLVTPGAEPHSLAYAIESGLPVREHAGLVRLEPRGDATEVVFSESFVPRIWGTGGYLRGRREKALIDVAAQWAATVGATDGGQS